MLVIVNQAFECRHPKTGEKFVGRNKDIITPPEWVLEHSYFKALCDEGKITCHYSARGVDEQLDKNATPPVAPVEENAKKQRR